MFDNKCEIERCKCSITIDNLISNFLSLSYKIAEEIIKSDSPLSMFKDEFIKKVFQSNGLRYNLSDVNMKDGGFSISNESKINECAGLLMNYFSVNMFNINDSMIDSSNILFIIKKDNLVFFHGENSSSAIKTVITKSIKNLKLYECLLNNIEDSKLKIILNDIKSFDTDSCYFKVVEVNSKQKIFTKYIPYEIVNVDLITLEPLEKESLYINTSKISKYINEGIDYSEIRLLKDKSTNNEIAIKFGKIIIPFLDKDYKDYIKDSKLIDYYWLLFKNTYSIKKTRPNFKSDLLGKFKELIKREELSRLLSFLSNNLYTTKEIPKDFKEFFEENIRIDKIDLSNMNQQLDFFVPNTETKIQTTLGIYSIKKISKNYNLRSWIEYNKQRKKYELFENGEKKYKDYDVVSTLKPEISFYFISNYFEELIENVIKELKIEYLSNIVVRLKNKGSDFAEFDFLLRGNNKIIFIEAKTKLSSNYIRTQIKKIEKHMEKLSSIKDSVEFVLLAAYSDDDCKEFKYFIDKSDNSDYNVKREELKTIPYDFKVPLPKYSNMQLRCIAEPEFDKLQIKIDKICKD